ncbi:hypothetical protein BDP27DRAFT_1429216 [Rhodocollybia butyracea]|uniref:Fungal-type protein kinase domain-containing protein n=1 Tax=Rhodocollybia butyracea TaxID=206335 RepID=A0A9P5PDA4_9AGAR|nr:hypothetical protein BDP27DRAFT_1429216 [Rhodocollybia butyracea]
MGATSLPFSSGGVFIETAFKEAARELEGRFSVVSAQNFLETYLPDGSTPMPEFRSSPFRRVANQSSEKEMYEPLIEALTLYLKQGWTLANTSDSPDPDSGFFDGHNIKPDLTLYSDKEPSNDNKCRACDMETFIELKFNENDDGFGDDIEELEDLSGNLATTVYRTHGFGVLVAGKRCRLLRHTRSGIEVTTRFNYTAHPHLATFFWRLSHASPAVRGIDDTSSLLLARRLLRFSMLSENPSGSHHYPVGRGTRCFVAVDCETWQKCVLKDTWRIIGYHREGEVYKRLHDNSVRNIPPIPAEADVAGATHSCGVLGPDWRFPSAGYTVRHHQHYPQRPTSLFGDPEEDREAQRIKDEIEKHDWMENALSNASGKKEWEHILDPSVDQEIELEKHEKSTRKRKSHYREYDIVFERRMKQRGEREPIPQEDDNDSDGM